MNPSSLIGHATELLRLIDDNSLPADRIVYQYQRDRKYLGSHDRRFVVATVFAIIRNRRLLEVFLERFVEAHPDHNFIDDRDLRYLPLYATCAFAVEQQLICADEVIPSVPESLWSMTFPSLGLGYFKNWLTENHSLQFLPRDDVVLLGVKHSFQDWMVEEWEKKLGDEVEQLLVSLNGQAPTVLRVNLAKTTREGCIQRLQADGISAEPATISPAGVIVKKRFNKHSSPVFKEGLFEMQDEGSQIISLLIDPRPNDIIIDACAGAGGKSLHMAELMKNTGEIIAIDVDGRRLSELEERSARAGAGIIRPVLKDNVVPENFFGKADIVLVDAPCSGVGTIRRNPWFKWSVTDSLVNHYHDMQNTIMEFNARFVKRNGMLVYTTCSLFSRENEEIVRSFLSRHPDFRMMMPEEKIARYGLQTKGSFLTLFPHRHHTDGFFFAMLQRCS